MTRRYASREEGSKRNRLTLIAAVLAAVAASPAAAQLPMPASTQFDITGFIQEATLGAGTSGLPVGPGTGAHAGGIIKVNGHVIIVPSETIVILPASAYTWAELFALSPAPYTGVATGLALADLPAPLTTYEAHVTGNRVLGGQGGPDAYIAGLVHISQQDLNSGSGFINFMDYDLGEMRVGGKLPDANCAASATNTVAGGPACSGARVRLNDPVGRFGRQTAVPPTAQPDPRFAVDDANPTIIAGNGFPMCFPRTDPAGLTPDTLCPQANRPAAVQGFASAVQMNDPRPLCTDPPTNTIPAGCSTTGVGPNVFPSALVQAPMEVGDYVSFAGTVIKDGATSTQPYPLPLSPATPSSYVAAHTITSNVAIYTWPGTNPAYVMVDVALIGTGGLTVIGAGEAVIRTRFEGMTTDASRNIHLYGIDLAADGSTTDRSFGVIVPDPGPPAGPVKGRWRFRPPCLPFGSNPTVKDCVTNPAGTFLPPPRELRAVIEGAFTAPITLASPTAANGIVWGQYHAPIGEYIFPENLPGTPIVENNFNTVDFLAKGGYTSSAGTVVGVLNPWPSNIVPTPTCTPPTASTGGPYTAAAGASIQLNGSSTGTGPFTYAWTADVGTLSSATLSNPFYTAPLAGGTANLSLTVTGICGSPSTATTTVTVNAVVQPTVAHVNPIVVNSSVSGSFIVAATDPNTPALVPLTFTVTQTGAPALTVLTVTQLTPTSATVNFTAPALPAAQVTPTVINLTITARNTANSISAPEATTITVNPLPDAVAITATEYRTGKQRLVINASSSVVSPNVILTLQPYACQTVAGQPTCPPTGVYNPDPAAGGVGNVLTNNGGGLYIGTLVGAPAPACNLPNGAFATPCTAAPLQVKSNHNGLSPFHGLDKIRQ